MEMNMQDWEQQERAMAERAQRAQAQAAQALERLLRHAETGSGGQMRYVARFIAATFDGATFPLNPFYLFSPSLLILSSFVPWTCRSAMTCWPAWTRCAGGKLTSTNWCRKVRSASWPSAKHGALNGLITEIGSKWQSWNG